jgi:uroporphyrin-III C-methyltransferase
MSQQASRGKVFLIGAGPGDPDLLTIKAARVLGQCDVVLYDRLVSAAILRLARPEAELIYVGKREGEQHRIQSRIFDLLLQHAQAGKLVARLKGGDPLVFGRGAEEWALVREHGIEVELVPGVTSAVSAPGLAGIPLTYREVAQSFAVITGHCKEGLAQHWADYARIDTLVILMGVKNRAYIAQALVDAGRAPDEPAAFIERATSKQQRIVITTLGEIAGGRVAAENPAVWVIGSVVRIREKLIDVMETAEVL